MSLLFQHAHKDMHIYSCACFMYWFYAAFWGGWPILIIRIDCDRDSDDDDDDACIHAAVEEGLCARKLCTQTRTKHSFIRPLILSHLASLTPKQHARSYRLVWWMKHKAKSPLNVCVCAFKRRLLLLLHIPYIVLFYTCCSLSCVFVRVCTMCIIMNVMRARA